MPEQVLTEWATDAIKFGHDVIPRDEFSRYCARLATNRTINFRGQTRQNPIWDEMRRLEAQNPDLHRTFFSAQNMAKFDSVAEVKDVLIKLTRQDHYADLKSRVIRASDLPKKPE